MKVMTEVGPIDCTLAVGADPDLFKCFVCGAACDIKPVDNDAFCEAHCPDHIYESFASDGKRCRTCFAPMPDDWK